ncbi:WD domain, G-beta repeat protein, partial [Rhizoctonia solani AG-3 Rhs1AP]
METTNADQARNPEPDVRPTVTEEDSDSDAGTAPNEEIHPTGVDVETKHNRNPSRSYSAKHTGSTSQRQLERVGATNIHLGEKRLVEQEVEAFNRFDKELNNVNAALRLLGSTMQLFGSSVGVLHAIYQLRKSLLRLQFHATTLYDNSIKPNEKRYVREVKPEMKANGRIKDHKPKETLEVLKQKTEGKRYKNINGSMEEVAINLEMFVIRINEISGFYDELVNQTFTDFAKELQALKSFQKNSIPIIQRSQERRGLGLQGLSAVRHYRNHDSVSTGRHLYSSAKHGEWTMDNGRMSRFSSPSKHTPGFIARVLQYTPLIYLCLSVSMLMVGLSVSHQRNSTLTTNAEKYAYLDAMKLLTAISRHNGLIKHLAFSPDQTLLATCGWDGTVVISNADEIEPPIFTLKHTEEEAPTEPQPLQKPLFGKDSAGEFCDYSKLQGTQSTQDIRALSREISIKDLVITSMATVNDCSIPHVNNFGVPDAKNADTKNNPNIEVEKFLFLYNFISGEFSR